MRGITQAPVAQAAIPQHSARANSSHISGSGSTEMNGHGSDRANGYNMTNGFQTGKVHRVTTLKNLDMLLESAKHSCAVIFFTSATCPPCKLVYPAYDELAVEAGKKAVLIKVDLSEAYEIGSKYQVRATPTFMSFLKGEKENEWVGASESQLKGNVRMLIQMAYPLHPHTNLRLRVFQRRHKPVIYNKIPPIEKLIAKMGPRGSDPAAVSLKDFICAREASGAAEAPLPSIPSIEAFVVNSVNTIPSESLFPVVDMVRCILIDQRMSACFATAGSHQTIMSIFTAVESLGEECPYSLRIVTLQLACNLFTSSIFATQLIQQPILLSHLLQLVTVSLLDTVHSAIRVAAASLAFNIAAFNHLRRLDGDQDLLPEPAQVELMASLLEATSRENESKDGLRGLFTAIGLLAYCAPRGGELNELYDALGAKVSIKDKKSISEDLHGLAEEVVQILS